MATSSALDLFSSSVVAEPEGILVGAREREKTGPVTVWHSDGNGNSTWKQASSDVNVWKGDNLISTRYAWV